jgi:hypothetical protein
MEYPPLDTVQEAMAKAFFASAYADQYDECTSNGGDPGFSPSGCDWMDLIPDAMDPAAIHAAHNLTADLLRANKSGSLAELMEFAEKLGPNGDRDLTSDMFGHYLAMQAMGHGVGLYDAFGKAVYKGIKVPYTEFSGASLENDYFPVTSGETEESV